MKPIWNEDIDFEMKTVSQANSTVRIGVWDEDIKFHDEIGADIFTFPHFYNNGTGQPEAKYLLFNKKQESTGTITVKTSYIAIPAPVAPKAEEKKEEAKVAPVVKVEDKKPEPPKVEPPKIEEKKPEPPKVVPPKVEEKKPVPPKVVPPKVEEKKADLPKAAVLPDIPKTQPAFVQQP